MVKGSRWIAVVFALAFAALHYFSNGTDGGWPGAEIPPPPSVYDQGLPPEAFETLELILNGGPFPYRQDNTVFQNREGLLPQRPLGYYREYTVRTPGAPNRGARRFVTGGNPPEVFYYTEDHYRSFREIQVPR